MAKVAYLFRTSYFDFFVLTRIEFSSGLEIVAIFHAMTLPALVVILFYAGFCVAGWAAIEDHIDRKTYPNAMTEEPLV